MRIREIPGKIKRKVIHKIVSAMYKTARIASGYRVHGQSLWSEMQPDYPDIYNEYGEKLHIFFLADSSWYSALPYRINSCRIRTPRFIYWDRYNRGLKTHFYALEEVFRPTGNPDRRFALFNESRIIKKKCHRKILRNKRYMENEFDLVFTCDEEILNTLSNARFVPIDANYWYGENDASVIVPDNYKHKDKGISIIASHKTLCPMHLVRQDTARRYLRTGSADAFGRFAGGGGGTAV